MLITGNPMGAVFIASGALSFGKGNGFQIASQLLGFAGAIGTLAGGGGTGGGCGVGCDYPSEGSSGGGNWLGGLLAADALAASSSGRSGAKPGDYRGKMPQAPPGVDVNANVKQAQARAGMPDPLTWFQNQVTDGGPWDYKQYGKYEDFGNWHYGVVGKAMGIPDIVLLNEAGINSVGKFGTVPGWGYPGPRIFPWLGQPPYGDDPRDQAWIKSGIDYYRQHYGR